MRVLFLCPYHYNRDAARHTEFVRPTHTSVIDMMIIVNYKVLITPVSSTAISAMVSGSSRDDVMDILFTHA